MFISLLLSSPEVAAAWLAAILISLTVHEFSHALVGRLRGDKTAEREGRLTLNPLAHVDWMGLIMLVLFGFGWAKPVPFNPYNLKEPKWDSVRIALAGPASNLVLAGIAAIALRALSAGGIAALNLLTIFLFLLILINLFLLFFNLVPVHPLDGSKLLFALLDKPKHAQIRQFIATRGPSLIFFLVIISLITGANVFFFVTEPSFATCDLLLGGKGCSAFLSAILSGI